MVKKVKGEPQTPAVSPFFFIGTVAQDNVDIDTCLCIQALRLSNHDFIWVIQGAGGNTRTKNIIMTDFVKQKWGQSPYLIFVDRDITFEPYQIDLILEDLQAGYDYVGGAYPVKDGSYLASWAKGGIEFDNTVKPIQWLSSGFTGMTRKLLQKMVKQLDLPLLHKGERMEFYPFGEQIRYKIDDIWMWLSEDYDFCNKVRDVGGEVYLDTRVTVGHVGVKLVTIKDVLKNQEKNEH
jgi:hypothetical protein